jgi:SPP1 family holin
MSNISKGTIVRTIMLILVLANIILKQCGYDIIDVSESEVLTAVETLIEIAVIVVAWWKNNSFSEKAIKADEFLKNLKESE